MTPLEAIDVFKVFAAAKIFAIETDPVVELDEEDEEDEFRLFERKRDE